MATQLITVNSIVIGSNFNVSSAEALANASDDSNSTSFQNTSGNQPVSFGLEGTGDYENLNLAASIVSIQPIVTMSQTTKGAASVATFFTDDGSAVNATVLSTNLLGATDLSASVYTPEAGLGGSKLNALEFTITGNTNTINKIFRVRFLVTFTAAAAAVDNNQYLGINGEMILDSGQINI